MLSKTQKEKEADNLLYNQGYLAYQRGDHIDDALSLPKDKRTAWYRGYLTARTRDRLRVVFKRNQITFP